MSNIEVKIDKDAIRRVAQEAFDEQVDVVGVEYDCPECGTKFTIKTGDNPCPECGFVITVEKGELEL